MPQDFTDLRHFIDSLSAIVCCLLYPPATILSCLKFKLCLTLSTIFQTNKLITLFENYL